jgi:hypothetical protein
MIFPNASGGRYNGCGAVVPECGLMVEFDRVEDSGRCSSGIGAPRRCTYSGCQSGH